MLQSHIIRIVLVLLTIWCVSSSSIVPETRSEGPLKEILSSDINNMYDAQEGYTYETEIGREVDIRNLESIGEASQTEFLKLKDIIRKQNANMYELRAEIDVKDKKIADLKDNLRNCEELRWSVTIPVTSESPDQETSADFVTTSDPYEQDNETESSAVHLICNLKGQLDKEITSKNWKKVVQIMKHHLNEGTQLYKQLENIENIEKKDLPLTAAAKGYNDVIRVLLCHGLPIDEKYYKNYGTMLHEAAWRGQYNTVKLLITSGADVNFEDRYGSIPLHYAADSGNVDIIKFLIQRGSKINHPNKYWNYPIHWAVFNRRIQGVDSLLQNGADINVQNNGGETSLHVAVKEGQLGVVKLLLSKGCDASIEDDHGETALNYAQKIGHKEIEKFLESVVS